jgi:hypothetical protein
MTSVDYSTIAFALFNGARVLAYLPQIVRVYRDSHGATGVSVTTWSLFTAANVATISYAVTVSGDLVVAGVFGLTTIGCLVIVGLTAARRFRLDHQSRLPMQVAASHIGRSCTREQNLRSASVLQQLKWDGSLSQSDGQAKCKAVRTPSCPIGRQVGAAASLPATIAADPSPTRPAPARRACPSHGTLSSRR